MVALGPGFPFSDLSTPSVSLPRLRRIGYGLGCEGERPSSDGDLVCSSTGVAHQSKGAVCGPSGSDRGLGHSSRLFGIGLIRQSDSGVLHQQSGRTKSLSLLTDTGLLLEVVQTHSFTISARYLPGKYNGLADSLSRQSSLPDWHLSSDVTQAHFQR